MLYVTEVKFILSVPRYIYHNSIYTVYQLQHRLISSSAAPLPTFLFPLFWIFSFLCALCLSVPFFLASSNLALSLPALNPVRRPECLDSVELNRSSKGSESSGVSCEVYYL